MCIFMDDIDLNQIATEHAEYFTSIYSAAAWNGFACCEYKHF